MITQPSKESRNINNTFYESETQFIDELNKKFFHDIELTYEENCVLVWLCGLDKFTVDNIVSAFSKVKWK